MKVTNKEIAEFLSYEDKPKSDITVMGWKNKDPKLLELVKNGALLKKYDCDNHEELKEMIEIHNMIKDSGISNEQLKGLLGAVRACGSDK